MSNFMDDVIFSRFILRTIMLVFATLTNHGPTLPKTPSKFNLLDLSTHYYRIAPNKRLFEHRCSYISELLCLLNFIFTFSCKQKQIFTTCC